MPLPEGQPMFPLLLRNSGYYTVAAGKWHLGDHAKTAFDRIEGGRPGGEEHWLTCLKERPREKPFFMWFASLDAHRKWDQQNPEYPHTPADAVIPPYMAGAAGTRRDLASYYDEIARLDQYVGLVIDELQHQKILENTLICFMADNGRPFPRCKTWLYDSGIKTPLVMSWPDKIHGAGVVSDSLVSVIDLAPTFLEVAGAAVPEAMQGKSVTNLFSNPEEKVREYAFAEHNWHDMQAHERMVRWKQYKYLLNARPSLANWVHAHHAVPSYQDLFNLRKDGSLSPAQADVLRVPRPAEMLFDVEKDPHELTNLVDQKEYQEAVQHLRKVLKLWQDSTGDTVPENLTGDIIDRKTFEWLHQPRAVPRGTIPGSERNAKGINAPGPH
jgi:arylsulfatase A-like enzyme